MVKSASKPRSFLTRVSPIPNGKWIVRCVLLLSFLTVMFWRETGSSVSRDASTTSTLRAASQRTHNPSWEIFRPLFDMPEVTNKPVILGPPRAFIQNLRERLDWLDTITNVDQIPEKRTQTNQERAMDAYLETIQNHLSALVYGKYEKSVAGAVGQDRANLGPLNKAMREGGLDWTYLGETMVGTARLNNIKELLTDVIGKNIPGDYIETGVWRGGASMFARAVIFAHEQEKKRKSYVCDSFRGLPPGERGLNNRDKGWDKTSYLEVNEDIVAGGFQKYSLLDDNVIFAKGFFNETMPRLAPQIDKLAVMRLDGDLYESTVDVLYQLYEKLSVGGYVIMDDWDGFPSKDAAEDFFKVHNIAPKVIQIDRISAYWQKTEDIPVQFWRHVQGKYTDDTAPAQK